MPDQISAISAPLLITGERLSHDEFQRRYEAHPEIKKAELIEGVVHVSSPAHHKQHGRLNRLIATWLGVYESVTPGVSGDDNATLRLNKDNEVQPNALLRIDERLGGRSSVTADDYLEGAPELVVVVEVAASSVSYDLNAKRRVYEHNGVQEYLVLQSSQQRVTWFALHNGKYKLLPVDRRGILQSDIFPGLWLFSAALWMNETGDMAALLAALQEGLATEEHAAFVARLQEK